MSAPANGSRDGISIDRIPSVSASPPKGRGRLLTYALWQLRDFMIERGIALLFVGGLAALQIVNVSRSTFAGRAAAAVQFSTMIFPTIAPLFVLVAVSRIIASDRMNGYFRTIFSKPVSMIALYAQDFVVRGIGVLLCIAAIGGALRVAGVPVSVVAMVAYFANVYVVLGSIIMLASALVSYDWVIAAAIWFLAHLFSGASNGQEQTVVRSIVATLLPPVDALARVKTAIFAQTTLPAGDLIGVLGYGAICVALTLVLIRWRSMTR